MELLSRNYFELFGLPTQFRIDSDRLDQNYRKLQSEFHPDRFVSGSASEQKQSFQVAAHVNDAYRTLKHPTQRARYLLKLRGVDTLEESNTAMPADFLMKQMEWREAIEEAKNDHNLAELDNLLQLMKVTSKDYLSKLETDLADDKDLVSASSIVRKLSFVDKVTSDIEQIIIGIED